MARAFSMLSLALFYWSGVCLIPVGQVSLGAWSGLYLACNVSIVALWARRPLSIGPAGWLAAALYSVLFAVILFGANGALDALHGVNRVKAHVAESLGGLELWFVLCPGAFSVALASALHAWLRAR